jgi:hypothetical protein
MNFFRFLNDSVFSRQFYKNVPDMSAWDVIKFVVIICAVTAVFSGLSHTFYFYNKKTGIPAELTAMFGGMEFINGSLDPHRATPYAPDTRHLSKIFRTLFSMPQFFNDLPDSFLVVDTSSASLSRRSIVTQFLLTEKYLYANPGSTLNFKMPYTAILGGKNIVVSEASVRELLKKNMRGVAFNCIVQAGFLNTGIFILSIVFLTFAAYIFRIERFRGIVEFLKIASFAASPVYVGTNLVALSGTAFPWTWHVLILISTFVMFRGVQASGKNADWSEKKE